ncbi:MAG: GspE/PulE family protein [Pseudomonadota bacterium]
MDRKETNPPSATPASRRLELTEIVSWLAADRLISAPEAADLSAVKRRGAPVDVHPLVILAEKNLKDPRRPHKLLTLEALTMWLAGRCELPYERIDPLKIDVAQVTAAVSYAYCARRKILPIAVNAETITFATSEPFITDWVDELERVLRKRINRALANPVDIGRYLEQFYSLSRSVRRALDDATDAPASVITNLEQLVELGRSGKLDSNDHHVVQVVDWLLQYAFDQRASDIHLEPRRDQSDIRFRIDGVLHQVYEVPTPVMGAIIARIKTLGRMDVAEKRRPLDGRLKTRTPDGDEVELRLSSIPTALGEKMVMRIFDPSVLLRNFTELGLNAQEINIWQSLVTQPHGIVLVTGPTGSGKTTTLYSTLKQLARPEVNLCTIEDPIEMVEPSFNQMQVQHNIDLTFASGVRALLRQDPDIIMIGEIRDLETAEMAVQASLTGHLVFSTLHTNDAPTAITRLLELGAPAYLINATLLGVLAQRLVRMLCPHCKQPGELDGEAWRRLTQPWNIAKPTSAFFPKGCLECRNTGYYGRIGIYEMLTVTPALRKQIRPESDVATLRAQCLKDGMQPLRLSGARKVGAGLTTIEEILKVAPPPEES